MFTLSLKSPIRRENLRSVLIALACVIGAVITVIGVCFASHTPIDSAVCEGFGEYKTDAAGEKGREAFMAQFSLKAEELYQSSIINIPSEFNRTYKAYNELQKIQGLDLEPYKGRKCSIFVYKLKDCTIDGDDGYFTMIVYKGRVIGGHISSITQNSECHTFYKS